MQTLLLGTLYLPSATITSDLVLDYFITLNATEYAVIMEFGQILTANVVQRHVPVRITGMDLANPIRDNGLISSEMLRQYSWKSNSA